MVAHPQKDGKEEIAPSVEAVKWLQLYRQQVIVADIGMQAFLVPFFPRQCLKLG